MSVLILGGDRIDPIRKILMELGVSDIIHWTARNQKNGRYDGNVTDIKIVNRIVGLNSVVIARKFITKKDGEGDSQMTLFEFKNGKISRIFEYW